MFCWELNCLILSWYATDDWRILSIFLSEIIFIHNVGFDRDLLKFRKPPVEQCNENNTDESQIPLSSQERTHEHDERSPEEKTVASSTTIHKDIDTVNATVASNEKLCDIKESMN